LADDDQAPRDRIPAGKITPTQLEEIVHTALEVAARDLGHEEKSWGERKYQRWFDRGARQRSREHEIRAIDLDDEHAAGRARPDQKPSAKSEVLAADRADLLKPPGGLIARLPDLDASKTTVRLSRRRGARASRLADRELKTCVGSARWSSSSHTGDRLARRSLIRPARQLWTRQFGGAAEMSGRRSDHAGPGELDGGHA